MRTVNGDLFADPPPPPATKHLPAQRPLAANTIESRPASDKDRTRDGQILHQVKANGSLGITRNELHDKTGISIQTLSWSLQRLLQSGRIYRRLDTSVAGPKLRFISRGKCYVVYAELYRPVHEGSDHPPFQERNASPDARRSA